MPYLFDILIVVLLAFFAWRGATKGLILSLCGLAAVFVAFFGAQFISDQFSKPVGNIIRPVITQSFREMIPESDPTAAEGELPSYTVDELLEAVKEHGLFEGFSDFLEQGIASDSVGHGALSPLDSLAVYLAEAVARALLFGITFLGILLIWFLVSHALDLAFKLPILAEVNTAGGLIVGLVKGVLLTIVLVWLAQMAGIVPGEPDTPVLSLFTVKRLGELLMGLPG